MSNSQEPPVCLITGATRGIGLALAGEYSSRGWRVIASFRAQKTAGDLQALSKERDNIELHQLDVTDVSAVNALSKKLKDVPIDVLLNNAGLLGRPDRQSINCVDATVFRDVTMTNTFAPLMLSLAFLEQVARSRQKKIISLTSGLSSVAKIEQFGNLYFYRASKAGLNAAMRALQADLRPKGIICGVVAPGIVDTGLLRESGYSGESLSARESAAGLADLIDGFSENSAAGFPLYDGSLLPW